jgi:hypothetical protein
MNKNFKVTQIKSLASQIEKGRVEIHTKESELKLIQEELRVKHSHLQKLQEEIDYLKSSSSELIISEHALLRYLERVYKLDLEKLSSEIVPESLKSTIEELGNGEYHTQEGYSLKVYDNVVVTILDDAIKESKRVRKRKSGKKPYEPTLKEQLKEIV